MAKKHMLLQEVVDGVPTDTEDNDAIMNNCFLENRHALLSFCQGNHYQFDTLRRAKHSSMMILYHLHHPIGSMTGITCSLCLKDVVLDQQWKCNLCPESVVCAACYQRNGVGCHTHNLTQNLAPTNLEVNAKRAQRVKELLDVLLRASKCRSVPTSPCNYPNCFLMKKLFSHAKICETRVAGGCLCCKKVWYMANIAFSAVSGSGLLCPPMQGSKGRFCREERDRATEYNSRGYAVVHLESANN